MTDRVTNGKDDYLGKKRAQVESPNFTAKTKKVNQVPNIYIFCYQVSKNEKAKCYKKETTLCFFVVIRGLTATKASLALRKPKIYLTRAFSGFNGGSS